MTDSLIARISVAFQDVECPEDDAISTPTYDDEGTTAQFANTRWQDHAEPDTSALLWFTPAAFRYFLPAYLIASLKDPSSVTAEYTIDHLCPPKNNPRRPSYLARWSLLSKEQRLCVIAFLERFQPNDAERLDLVIESLKANVDG
jgi:hypothetical protein